MTQHAFLLVTIAFCSLACGEENVPGNDLLNKAQAAIGLCVDEYSRLSGSSFFDEVEGAYVFASATGLGVVFVSGKRSSPSDFYAHVINCGVSKANEKEIYFLGSAFKDPLIHNEAMHDETFESEDVLEMFYERNGDQFVFLKSQKFTEPKTGHSTSLD